MSNSDKCSWLGCRNESDMGCAFMRNASLCTEHHKKWCEIDKDLGPWPYAPDKMELKIRRVKAFLKNLKEYSKIEDVSPFVDAKGNVIRPEHEV